MSLPVQRKDIKLRAKAGMGDCRGACVAVYVLTLVLSMLCTSVTAGIGTIFIVPALEIAAVGFFVRIYRGEALRTGDWFSGMFDNYLRKIGSWLWKELWLVLWSLLACGAVTIVLTVVGTLTDGAMADSVMGTITVSGGALDPTPYGMERMADPTIVDFVMSLVMIIAIIPVAIKAISYSLTSFIVAAHPDVMATDALKLSKIMTKGHKWDLVVAALSFLLWELLSVLTLGILEIVYVGPYRQMTFAGIYTELEKSALDNGAIVEEHLSGELRP